MTAARTSLSNPKARSLLESWNDWIAVRIQSELTSLQNLPQMIGKAKRFSQLSCPGPPAYLTPGFKQNLRLKTNAVRL